MAEYITEIEPHLAEKSGSASAALTTMAPMSAVAPMSAAPTTSAPTTSTQTAGPMIHSGLDAPTTSAQTAGPLIGLGLAAPTTSAQTAGPIIGSGSTTGELANGPLAEGMKKITISGNINGSSFSITFH